MVLVYLNNSECIEVANAVRAEAQGNSLLCFDRDGIVTATFAVTDVEAFTANDEVAEQIKEEVCEDLTVVGEEERESEVELT